MNAIVAVDENWGIGYKGELLARISADLRRFKALTTGHAVILGRKTLQTFPGGEPLPGRENLIMSTTMDVAPEGAKVFRTLDEVLAYAPEDAFVIGGESVYRALLPHCHRVYVTKIHKAFPHDAVFPNLDALDGWKVVENGETLEENGLAFSYVTYENEG